MNRKYVAFLAAAATVALPTAASGQSPVAGFTIGIEGNVPVVCRASFEASSVAAGAGEISLGKLSEFCNSANGYQLYVEASPELASAKLIVDGDAVALDGSAPTLVLTSDAPGIASRDVTLLAANSAGGSLSFRIVPL